jgi:RNA polymerase sigma-70 factor, ECF subfamily
MAASSEQLMLSVARGDRAAFNELVLRHQESAWTIAYRFLCDRIEAEDIVQTAFLKILEGAPRYQPTAEFSTYLCRVVTRLCMDFVKKKKPFPFETLHDRPDLSQKPTHGEEDMEVRKALDALPPHQRMAAVLRYYEDLNYRQIADSMEITEKAVEGLLDRARKTLAVKLVRYFEK